MKSDGSTIPQNPGFKEKPGAFVIPLILKIFGRTFAYIISPFPLLFYYLLDTRSRRNIVRFHHRIVQEKSKIRRFISSYKNFHYFGTQLIDRVSMISGNDALDCFDSNQKEDFLIPGSILVASHIGVWSFAAIGLNMRRQANVTHFSVVMDPEISKKFNKASISSPHKFDVIDANQDGLTILLQIKETIDSGGCVCFMGDRSDHGQKTDSFSFLGDEAEFPLTPFEIARCYGTCED